MIFFFQTQNKSVIATEVDHQLNNDDVKKLCWLYGDAELWTTRRSTAFS